MIRNAPVIRTRLGFILAPPIQAGAGGSAADYNFNPPIGAPATPIKDFFINPQEPTPPDVAGLSNDSRLAYYLQNLTPAQLQTALDGGDPSGALATLLYQDQTATGAGYLPNAAVPTSNPLASIPLWVWIAALAAAAGILIWSQRR